MAALPSISLPRHPQAMGSQSFHPPPSTAGACGRHPPFSRAKRPPAIPPKPVGGREPSGPKNRRFPGSSRGGAVGTRKLLAGASTTEGQGWPPRPDTSTPQVPPMAGPVPWAPPSPGLSPLSLPVPVSLCLCLCPPPPELVLWNRRRRWTETGVRLSPTHPVPRARPLTPGSLTWDPLPSL